MNFVFSLIGVVAGIIIGVLVRHRYKDKIVISREEPLNPSKHSSLPEPSHVPPVPPVPPKKLSLVEKLNAKYQFADVKLLKTSNQEILLWKNAVGKKMQSTLNPQYDHWTQACQLIEDSLHDLSKVRNK